METMQTMAPTIEIPEVIYKNLEKKVIKAMSGKSDFKHTRDPENMRRMIREIARTGIAIGAYENPKNYGRRALNRIYAKLLEEIGVIEQLKNDFLVVEGINRRWDLPRSEILEAVILHSDRKIGLVEVIKVQNGNVKYAKKDGRVSFMDQETYESMVAHPEVRYILSDSLVNLSRPSLEYTAASYKRGLF